MRYLAIDSESIESFVVFLTLDFFIPLTSSPFSILPWNPLSLRYLYRGRWYMPVDSMPMYILDAIDLRYSIFFFKESKDSLLLLQLLPLYRMFMSSSTVQ